MSGFLHFPNVPCTKTCLPTWYQVRLFKLFLGERGCPWYGPSAPPGRNFAIRTLGYKRAFGAGTRYASVGLFLGIFGATGRDQGGTSYGTSAKPERHFTKGMFGKP